VNWFKFPTNILDSSKPEFARWFTDGKINITYNMFDRYMEKHAEKPALIWVSNMVNKEITYTLK
jgi:propionyl-CoA synthetase